MQARVLVEAGEVALGRWEATEPRGAKKQRRQEALLREVEALLARRWAETEPPGPNDVQAQLAAANWWVTDAAAPTYRLFDAAGQPIKCHICGHDHSWTPEGDSERHVVRMFVCEHEPLRIGHGFVRQVSTVGLQRVARCEATERGA
jgi:hypothetical protein